MELRAGYKQTETGIFPEEWDIARIVDVASITTGSRNTQDRVDDGAFPFFVRSQTIERINSFSFDGEAVLTAGDGVGTGKVFHYINGKFDLHQRVYKISNFSGRLVGYFFYVYFSNRFFDRIMSMTAKSSVDSVRREMIADMLIPLPPPTEQRAIAAALSDLDALIASMDALIAKKRDLKQAAMQQLLTGMARLPGFKGEWATKRLGDVSIVDPENLSAGTSRSYAFKYISLEDVDAGRLLGFSELEFRSAPSRARRKITFGDILVATVRPNLKSHLLFLQKSSDWICSTGFAIVRCIPEISSSGYVFQHMFGNVISEQIEKLITGSNYPAISSNDVRALQLPMPSVEEQSAIADVLSDMDTDLIAIEAKRDKVRALKQGMVQELLTGRIRLG
jgi:type I restriction enzyme, S subunit